MMLIQFMKLSLIQRVKNKVIYHSHNFFFFCYNLSQFSVETKKKSLPLRNSEEHKPEQECRGERSSLEAMNPFYLQPGHNEAGCNLETVLKSTSNVEPLVAESTFEKLKGLPVNRGVGIGQTITPKNVRYNHGR